MPRNRSVKAGGGQLTRFYTDALQGFVFDVAPDTIRRLKDGDPKIAYCEQYQVMTVRPLKAAGKPGGGGSTQPAQEKPWGITRINGGVAGVRDGVGH